MEQRKYKGLIFDYGGTLDTNANHWANVLWAGYCKADVPVAESLFRSAYVFGERALAKAPIITPQDSFRDVLRKKVDQQFFYLCSQKEWTLSEEEQKKAQQLIVDFCYDYALGHITESREVLRRLSSRYRMVLVSNFYGNINTILKEFNLPFFEEVIESAVVGVRKPDPAIWQLGVEALGLPTNKILIIGDSLDKDILPAQSLGCSTVWLKGQGWNKDEDDKSQVQPSFVITDIRQLLELL